VAHQTKDDPMIILPNQKLGFIAITKCASTSVEAALKGQKSVTTGGTAGLKHLPYTDVEKFVLPLLDTQTVERPHFFAVVRHPAARLLSWYNFRRRESLEAKKNPEKASRHIGDMALEEFVDQAILGEPGSKGHVHTQMHYVTDAAGRVAVDTLIRIEHLDALLSAFLERFNVHLEAPPARLNISPDSGTGAMPEALVARITASDRFGPDLDLYHQGVSALPDTLPLGKRAMKRAANQAARALKQEQGKLSPKPSPEDAE
jgi:hypothetical protein